MDFKSISPGFPTGHMRRGGRGLIDTALRQNVHVFHGLKRKGTTERGPEPAMGEVQLGGSIHGLLVVYILYWVMMMVNDDG